MLGETLVTIPHRGHILLALTLSRLLIAAAAAVHGAQRAAGAQLAAVRVLHSEVPVAGRAVVAPRPADECLAVTLASHSLRLLAGPLVTHSFVHRPLRHAVALTADIRVGYLLLWILERGRSDEAPLVGCGTTDY